MIFKQTGMWTLRVWTEPVWTCMPYMHMAIKHLLVYQLSTCLSSRKIYHNITQYLSSSKNYWKIIKLLAYFLK